VARRKRQQSGDSEQDGSNQDSSVGNTTGAKSSNTTGRKKSDAESTGSRSGSRATSTRSSKSASAKTDESATVKTTKKTAKKTTKKATAKKTTKKAAAKKTTKKVTKKAAKKTAKKAAAKKTTKKVAKKAAKTVESSEESTEKKVAKKVAKKAAKKTARKTTKKASKKTTTKSDGDATEEGKESTSGSRNTRSRGRRKSSQKPEKTAETTAETEDSGKASSDGSSGDEKPSRRRTRKKSGRKSNQGSSSEKSSESGERGNDKRSRGNKGGRKREDQDRSGRSRTNAWGRTTRALPDATNCSAPGNRIMVVNEVPGEECRVAILDKNRLDEYFVERAASATVVGNIYKARVTNIEPAIQAAFVDFGLGESGFLHVSDLHPRYFPGEGMVEQVGKKIPRRQRPPIQDALTKGQEILVQVLKQGIGSKGPTLTSYLSIPGRLMVMMPNMDRVGVSRKVANDEQRRSMREILDTLDLPDGFGFIVRTAGFNASKAELKRDVAYLKRLWQQIDKRISNTGAPCLLYAESDLLIRTIRDVVDSTVSRILIDEPQAFERATGFLQVAAPRSAPSVRFYDQSMPVFSTYDVERQIDQIHEETVPLKSGGALVIQQTEALVAIDVNSGRSRSARDSETNAYETNIEAVDEICRQLRLRDLGGVIINDLIDMRQQKHRQEIENRLVQNLGRDRAKTTVLPISEFGIVEMTRQRMRPNTQRANYQTCDSCEGRGVQLRVDAVAADAIRKAATILDNDSTSKVELVCSSDVASKLTNDRRQTIAVLEERFEKKIAVRVSETIPNNRVDLYAYDSQGADIEPKSINRQKLPTFEDFPDTLDDELAGGGANGKKTGKRRRRRRGKTAPADATAIALAGGFEIDEDEPNEESGTPSNETKEGEGTGRKRRRRRGGRNRRRKSAEQPAPETLEPMRIYALAKELGITSREILDRCAEVEEIEVKNHMSSVGGEAILMIRGWFTPEPEPTPEPEAETVEGEEKSPEGEGEGEGEGKGKRKRRRRRRGRRGRGRRDDEANQDSEEADTTSEAEAASDESTQDESTEKPEQENTDAQGEGGPRKRRRRRGGRRRRNKGNENQDAQENETQKNEGRDSNAEPSTEAAKNDRDHENAREVGDEGRSDKPKRRRSRKRSSKSSDTNAEASQGSSSDRPAPETASSKEARPKTSNEKKDAPRKPRTLYGGRIRRLGVTDQSRAER
jgi:ribonuclease E